MGKCLFKIGEMSGGFQGITPWKPTTVGMSAFLFSALFSFLAPVLRSTFVLSRCYYATLDSCLYTILSCPISGSDLPLSSSICLVPVVSSFVTRQGLNSGVDVNFEVPEPSRKNVKMTIFDNFSKIYRFFLREILNDPLACYK